MMMKIMMGILTGYTMLYMISLLLPNSSNPEVNILSFYLFFNLMSLFYIFLIHTYFRICDIYLGMNLYT